MDGRCSLLLALGLFGSLAGCTPSKWLTTTTEPVPLNEVPPAEVIPASKVPPKKLNPATLVSLANFRDEMYDSLGKTPAERQRVLEEAQRHYQQALIIDPNFAPAHLGLARHWEKRGDHARALSCYEATLKLVPRDAGLWHEIGLCHARHKEWEAALARLSKAVELGGEHRQYRSSHAMTLALAGRYDESLDGLKQLHREADAHYKLAQILHRINQDALAQQHLQAALQADPDHKSAQELFDTITTPTIVTGDKVSR